MFRRFPQRPQRRQHQDFHFFAAGDPIANIESQFARRAESPTGPSQPPAAVEPPEPPSPEVEATPPPIASTETAAAAPPPPPASATSGPPYTMSIAVPRNRIAALDRALRMRAPSEEGQSDEAEVEEEVEEDEDDDDESSLERTIRSVEKIRAGQSLFRPERPAIEELQALDRKTKRRRRSTARLATPRQSRPSPARPAQSLSDHELRCTICPHPYRDEIENEFMHWHTIRHISYDYEVSRSAIYRHAHALRLFSRRNRNLRFALGHLVERVQDVAPTADSIVRAVHAFARVNDDGEWLEPPAHVVVSSGGIRREAAAPPGRRPIAIDAETISSVIDVAPDPASPAAAPGTVNRVITDATR